MRINSTNNAEHRDDTKDIGTQFYQEYKKNVKQ